MKSTRLIISSSSRLPTSPTSSRFSVRIEPPIFNATSATILYARIPSTNKQPYHLIRIDQFVSNIQLSMPSGKGMPPFTFETGVDYKQEVPVATSTISQLDIQLCNGVGQTVDLGGENWGFAIDIKHH